MAFPSVWKVVLIDDEEDIRDVLAVALRDSGYHVITAKDGETGLEACRAASPQIVITDIRMPVRDGVSLVKYLLKEWPSKRIIVLTGYPSLDMALGFLKLGAIDYLVKPVEQDRLLAAVAKAFEPRCFVE